MYAIVKVGGKQYRVEKGDSLLVDRMPEDEGAKVSLEPLLLAPGGKGAPVFGGEDLAKVKVEATVTGHERGPKIHVLKFKPKRGYKRRQGHRSELTRLEIADIQGPGAKASGAKAEKPRKAKAAAAPKGKAEAAKGKSEQPKGKSEQPKAKAAPPKKDEGDKLEEATPAKGSATAAKPAAEPEPAEPAKPHGDKLEEAAKPSAKKGGSAAKAAKEASEKEAPAKEDEEESDGS